MAPIPLPSPAAGLLTPDQADQPPLTLFPKNTLTPQSPPPPPTAG